METRGLAARYDQTVPVYCVCTIAVEPNKPASIKRWFSVKDAVAYIQKHLCSGWLMVCHNAKYDYSVLKTHGLHWNIEASQLSVFCTMVAEYTRDSSLASYSLDALTGMKTDVVQAFVNDGLLSEAISLTKFWQIDWSNNDVALHLISNYCIDDLKATLRLYKRLAEWYNRQPNQKLAATLQQLEFPMLEVLGELERNGAYVDERLLNDMAQDLTKQKSAYETQILETAGLMPKLKWNKAEEEFQPAITDYKRKPYKNKNNLANHYSPHGQALTTWEGHIPTEASGKIVYPPFCTLVPFNSSTATGHTWWLIHRQCPEALETAEVSKKTGKPSLGKDFLKDIELPDELPLGKLVKCVKQLTMAESLQKHIGVDGRVRCNFAHTMTRTGRLATNSPNLQNISRPGTAVLGDKDYGVLFRSVFSASPGKVMLAADLDRIELSVLAWYLWKSEGDKSMLDVINSGADVHQANADKWGCSRNAAKTLIFLLVYGGSPTLIYKRKLAPTLEEAEQMFDGVLKGQPSLNTIKKKVWRKLEQQGQMTNAFNGCGVYRELQARNKWIKMRGERQSFNWLIQKTARDVMHLLVVESLPIIRHYGGALVNIIHDEVLVECDVDKANALKDALNIVWNNRYDLLDGVKVNGDWHEGANWHEAKNA